MFNLIEALKVGTPLINSLVVVRLMIIPRSSFPWFTNHGAHRTVVFLFIVSTPHCSAHILMNRAILGTQCGASVRPTNTGYSTSSS
jgi:hypothetical protein